MTESLSHPLWYRVADLRPRLRAHAAIHGHHYRGELWYVLQDRASTRYYRLSASSQQLLELMDGERSLQAIWDTLSAQLSDEAPSQGEVIQLLGKLHAADLLQTDVPPDTADMLSRGEQARRRVWQQRLTRPLAVRFALWDPDRFLTRFLPLVQDFFSPLGLLLWSALVVAAAVQATSHWPELAGHWSARAMDPYNLVLLALLYPMVKALHEFGHAFATKVWGGEVHEMGIMLLVLMPIPYVDASSAHAFREKHRRVVVGAAGIMVELFLSAAALFVWLGVQPGLLRDMAFDVMLIGGVSTLLFNGNPLLRFDGYYMLADLVEIPNLGPRANQYLAYLSRRYLFGLPDVPSPVTAPGERAWFVTYGVSAFVYRLFISFAIALLVAGKLFVIGVVLAIWALTVQILYPVARHVGFMLFNPALRGRPLRAATLVWGTTLAVVIAVCLLPVPSWTRAEAIRAGPDQRPLRHPHDAFRPGPGGHR